MRLLITGGAGFIGSNFIHYLLERHPRIEILNLDCLTYAGNLNNLAAQANNPRCTFVRGNIASTEDVGRCFHTPLDAIVNFAAETHVDRSILDAADFLRTNIVGTQVLLDLCRRQKIPRFVQVSTDEVYGTVDPPHRFTESSPLAPNSPYAASKAAADLMARAFYKTYGTEVIVTRSCNNYGPYQFPEKLIPLMILNALEDQPLPVYGDGRHIRDWIHVEDHCRALERILFQGRAGQIYNIGGNQERENLQVVRRILEILGKSESLIEFVEDRPGHDRRYAIDATRLRNELGWAPEIEFEDGLVETVHWYRDHGDWVQGVRDGSYRAYCETMYRKRDQTLGSL